MLIVSSMLSCIHAFLAVLAQQECSQLGLVVGIPVTFLVTAIISSLLTLLITCLCCLTRRRQVHTSTPQREKKPVRDLVSVKPVADIEMDSNVAYGTASENIIYEPINCTIDQML